MLTCHWCPLTLFAHQNRTSRVPLFATEEQIHQYLNPTSSTGRSLLTATKVISDDVLPWSHLGGCCTPINSLSPSLIGTSKMFKVHVFIRWIPDVVLSWSDLSFFSIRFYQVSSPLSIIETIRHHHWISLGRPCSRASHWSPRMGWPELLPNVRPP